MATRPLAHSLSSSSGKGFREGSAFNEAAPDAGPVLHLDLVRESGVVVAPSLHGDAARRESALPAIVAERFQRHACPVLLVRGLPQALGSDDIVTIGDDVHLDRDRLADHALDRKRSAPSTAVVSRSKATRGDLMATFNSRSARLDGSATGLVRASSTNRTSPGASGPVMSPPPISCGFAKAAPALGGSGLVAGGGCIASDVLIRETITRCA
jgi:hypothetical protein